MFSTKNFWPFDQRFATILALLGWMIAPASATTLMVGLNQTYKLPSDAVRAAGEGDTISIAPGTYFDCAVLRTNGVTVQGSGASVVLTDKICQGKAILVVHADNAIVRNITFTRARSADENGAGIRAEGKNLTVENTKFVNNQEGILAGNNPDSTIVIRNSDFNLNGFCGSDCAHAVYVNHIALLRVDHCHFIDTQIGHHIKSRAVRTEVSNSQITDGQDGTASYLIDVPNGGSLFVTGNLLEKGPKNQNHGAAIIIGEEGVSQPTDEISIAHNTFTNDGPPTTFVKNLTATAAQLTGNVLKGNSTTPLKGDGSVH